MLQGHEHPEELLRVFLRSTKNTKNCFSLLVVCHAPLNNCTVANAPTKNKLVSIFHWRDTAAHFKRFHTTVAVHQILPFYRNNNVCNKLQLLVVVPTRYLLTPKWPCVLPGMWCQPRCATPLGAMTFVDTGYSEREKKKMSSQCSLIPFSLNFLVAVFSS